MDFIIKVEKSSYLIKVKDLKITGLYGNKLFFDFSAAMSSDIKYWSEDGVHVNEMGANVKSELFASFISNYLKSLK